MRIEIESPNEGIMNIALGSYTYMVYVFPGGVTYLPKASTFCSPIMGQLNRATYLPCSRINNSFCWGSPAAYLAIIALI